MENFKKTCTEIIKIIPSGSKWKVESRFKIPVIVINIEVDVTICENISIFFDNKYDHKSIKKSSKLEKKLSDALGGVDKKQFLFTTIDGDKIFFCTWWPWGNQERVSLRVGIIDNNIKSNEEEELKSLLKEWFSIE